MSSVSLKSRVENHVVVIFLGALVAGFGAGMGAHKVLISETLERKSAEISACKEQLAAKAVTEKPADPARISFESTTSGDNSPINNSVGAGK
jgi:hypothetical protein